MAKIDLGQILTIALVVQQFVSKVKSSVKGTHAEKRAAIVKAVYEALPVVEQITGKELADDEQFKAGVTALADSFLKAPSA